MLPHEQPFVVANDARDDAEALRALVEQHSYLFFRGLMDADVIRQVRHDVLALCHDAGWLDPHSPLDEGVWSGTVAYVEGEPPYMEVYRQVLKLPCFQQLPHHPVFLDIAEKILGGPVLVHPRRIGRITFPAMGKVTATPPHQDWHFIRGTTQTYTMWLPLGDCPPALGGLAILAGSHRLAYQTHVPMLTWDWVPGASSYQVDVTPYNGSFCDWGAVTTVHWRDDTAVNAWTPLGDFCVEVRGPAGLLVDHYDMTQPELFTLPGEGAYPNAAKALLMNQSLTIAGGTTNINKNIVAERVLGLPPEPRP